MLTSDSTVHLQWTATESQLEVLGYTLQIRSLGAGPYVHLQSVPADERCFHVGGLMSAAVYELFELLPSLLSIAGHSKTGSTPVAPRAPLPLRLQDRAPGVSEGVSM